MAPGNGESRYEGVHCSLAIRPMAGGVVVLEITGTDVGEFGNAPMERLTDCLAGTSPIRLFIDARNVRGASIEVSAGWAQWLRAQRVRLSEVHMLTGSRFVEITADFVRRFADLEAIMRVYTEPAAFDAALKEAAQ